MNKKATLLVGIIVCLVAFVPLVVAQTQNGDVLQTKTLTQQQIGNCDKSYVTDGTACNGCQQNQTCIQNQQCQADCDNVCDGTGICNQECSQTQTRQRLCQQEGIQAGITCGQRNGFGQQFQGKNCQAP